MHAQMETSHLEKHYCSIEVLMALQGLQLQLDQATIERVGGDIYLEETAKQ